METPGEQQAARVRVSAGPTRARPARYAQPGEAEGDAPRPRTGPAARQNRLGCPLHPPNGGLARTTTPVRSPPSPGGRCFRLRNPAREQDLEARAGHHAGACYLRDAGVAGAALHRVSSTSSSAEGGVPVSGTVRDPLVGATSDSRAVCRTLRGIDDEGRSSSTRQPRAMRVSQDQRPLRRGTGKGFRRHVRGPRTPEIRPLGSPSAKWFLGPPRTLALSLWCRRRTGCGDRRPR